MYIPPREGCMGCNIGDSVEFLSDNVLRLSLHRVTPYPAEAGKVKLTVVCIMRPETDAVFFVDREGKQWKSVDWHNMEQRLFAKDLEAQKIHLGLTGRLGHNDGEVAAWRDLFISKFTVFHSFQLLISMSTSRPDVSPFPECVQEVTR